MRSGMIGFLFGTARVDFSPARLFSGSEIGGYWDVSVIGSLWKDTAGTIPVSVDGDQVARMDDLSGNGFHAFQSAATNRPIYRSSGGKAWLEGNGSRWLTVTGSAAAFAFAHKGAGTTALSSQDFYASSNPNAVCGAVGNCAGTTTQVGFNLYFDDRASVPANNRFTALVSRGVSNSAPVNLQTNDVVTPGAPSIVALRHSAAAGVAQSVGGATVATSSYSTGLSSSNAANDVQLMALGAGVLPLVGKFRGAVILDRFISSEEYADCVSWFAALE